VVKAAGQCY